MEASRWLLKGGFKHFSTQGKMGKKVQIIDACSSKVEVKNEEEKKRGLT